MKIDNLYTFGDTVYLRTDVNQYPRMVVCLRIYKDGEIMYELMQGTYSSWHFDYEFSPDKDILIKTDN